MTNPKWKQFEKLVAAVNKAMDRGATVKWDDHINGRQFDVTIRFRYGNAYDYLTVIECKDEGNAVEVGAVDGFVTKSHDAKANKAIMVSSSGFQSGAIACAERNNIDLYSLVEVERVPEAFLTNVVAPALGVHGFVFRLTDGKRYAFPERPNECDYFAKHTRITIGTKVARVFDVVMTECTKRLRRGVAEDDVVITFPSQTTIVRPDVQEQLAVARLSFRYELTTARLVKPGTREDPHVFSGAYELRNTHTDEATILSALGVQPGWDTTFTAKRFYRDPATNFKYTCEAVEGEHAQMFLIESYQHGEAIQARMTMFTKDASHYVEITDPVEVARLDKMYHLTVDREGSQ